jgi:hypothetical protein
MKIPKPPADDVLPAFATILLVVIVVLFAVRNLPWHLDDLDQAKQAYVSYQMVEDGRWLVQNTPAGGVATKPPLQGWLSALVWLAGGGEMLGFPNLLWEIAWRLPAFLAALLILRQLWRTGETLFGNNIGAVLAVCAFGLNFYVPRLATLVRTDMLLTAFIFFVGWMSLEKLRTGEPWTTPERVTVSLLLLGSMLTKGPIALAFLAPGMIAFHFLSRGRRMDRHVFCGWLWWVLPLLVFGAWAWHACRTMPGFYEEVVGKEFLGRFTAGKAARHGTGWPGEYTLGLFARTLPWTLLLAGALWTKPVRAALREDAVLLWLACWTAGGLLFMECVPAKRFDRILPVVPPLCLLLVAAVRHLPGHELWRQPTGRLAILLPFIGALLAGGYAGVKVASGFRDDARALVRFGQEVQQLTSGREDRLAVVNGKDEGMLLYTDARSFTRLEDALGMWRFKKIDWLVLGEGDFEKHRTKLEPFNVVASSPPLPEKFNHYRLLHRIEPPPPAVPVLTEKAMPGGGPPPAEKAPAWQPPPKLQ